MKKLLTVKELDAEKGRLVRSLNLFRAAESPESAALPAGLDLSTLREVLGGDDLPWGEEGLFPESAKFLAGISKSEEAKRLCLESDVGLLREVKEKGSDIRREGPFGFVEAVLPVRVRGATVHCIWSGKARERAFSEKEIADAAKLSGLSVDDVARLARQVPVVSKAQFDRAVAVCSRLRAAVEGVLVQQLHGMELSQQLVQSERTHSLGTLSGGVAHHFNNLLSVILGYSSFVLNREKLSKDAAEALHKISEAAQRGRRLTEEVLAFLGSEVEEDVPCPVHDTVSSVLSLLESKTGTAVRVDKKLGAKSDVVIAEPSAIRQIVFNLLTNAIDSMPSGGVLSIATTNTQMATEGGKREFLRLEVTDSGGVSAPRAREGSAVRSRLGLKLSSVYGMVGRLDGTVVVTSDPGATTRVEVLLPTASLGAEVQEERKVRHRLVPSTIWVVDDDPIFREMCHQVLSDDGHEVAEMSGGKEFMDLWRRGGKKPELIIMDFSMPEYNGLQLCEWLREEGAKVPVILVSGFASNQPDIKKALKLKKTHFLQKPFSFREMTDTVTVALGETLIG